MRFSGFLTLLAYIFCDGGGPVIIKLGFIDLGDADFYFIFGFSDETSRYSMLDCLLCCN